MRLFWSVVTFCVVCALCIVTLMCEATNFNPTKNSINLLDSSAVKTAVVQIKENKMQRANNIPYKQKWVRVSQDDEKGIIRDVDTASITFSSYNKFIFIHRIILKSPVEISNNRFQFVLAVSMGDCSTWTTRSLSDVEYLGTEKVSKDVFIDPADVEAPKDSFNDQILQYACKLRGLILI